MSKTPKFRNLEKKAGHKSARNLEFALKSHILNSYLETTKSTGEMLKLSSVKERMKKGHLERINIYQSSYGFMLNHGFEGTTAAGHHMKLRETNHLNNAVERSRALETLGTELSEIRADEIVAEINF